MNLTCIDKNRKGDILITQAGSIPLNVMTYISVIAYMLYLFIGVHALLLDHTSNTNRIFSLMCLCLFFTALFSSFMFSAKSVSRVLFYFRLVSNFCFFYLALNVHLLIIMVLKKRLSLQNILLFYASPVILIFSNISNEPIVSDFERINGVWTFGPAYGSPWLIFAFIFIAACFISTLCLYIIWLARIKTKKEKKQAVLILSSYAATLIIGCLDAWILPFFMDYKSPGLTPVIFIVYAAGAYVAITRYRFLALTPQVVSNEIIENIDNIVLLFDSEGTLVFQNRYAKDLIGESNSDPLLYENLITRHTVISEKTRQMKCDGLKEFTFPVKLQTKQDGNQMIDAHFSLITDKFDDLLGILMLGYLKKNFKVLQSQYKVTNREVEIIHYIATGLQNKEIADVIQTTERTVKAHVTNIFNKTGINSRIQLINLLQDFDLVNRYGE